MVQATLMEGAIGYRKFAVISGQKAMAVLRLSDGSHPPFGAEDEYQQTAALSMMTAMFIPLGDRRTHSVCSGVALCIATSTGRTCCLPICLTACYCHASIKAM
ncbi:hypothetical protein ACLBOM_13660 [Escherichia coli]